MFDRFPGANFLNDLWELLLSNNIMVERASSNRLRLFGPKIDNQLGTKWWGNFLRNLDAFDHRFFKKLSRETIAWDS